MRSIFITACSAGWLICAATAVTGVELPLSLNAETAAPWPRLFYTPDERVQIEHLRSKKGETKAVVRAPGVEEIIPPAVPVTVRFMLDGIAHGSQGKSASVNGQWYQSGEEVQGYRITVHPQSVVLSQEGQEPIRLKPGQQVELVEREIVDVVPPGTYGHPVRPSMAKNPTAINP